MRVFNPDASPVTVDDGRIVPSLGHADVAPSERVQALLDAGYLIETAEPESPRPQRTSKDKE